MSAPIHLQPTAELAERVLLPGDPGRALLLAQHLLDEPRMFNHHRGLWGYSGKAADGAPLTIQSTGMGGPSAAIVITELAGLGARRLVRVGTCGALDRRLELGDLVIATESIAADGTSIALGASGRVSASEELVGALRAACEGGRAGPIASTDLFYEERSHREREWIDSGAMAVEMESATLFALAERRGLTAASLLIVTDLLLPTRVRIDVERLRRAEQEMGEVAVRGLAGG